MKWREFYRDGGMLLSDTSLENLLERMSEAESLSAYVFAPGVDDPKKEGCDEFHFIVVSIRMGDQSSYLKMTIKTRGHMPEGLKHGTYEVEVRASAGIGSLSESMFEDAEVPDEMAARYR